MAAATGALVGPSVATAQQPHHPAAVGDLMTAFVEPHHTSLVSPASARVEGIDVLHIGASDLSTEMGIPGQYTQERMSAAFEIIARAAKGHGKAMEVGDGVPICHARGQIYFNPQI